MQAPVQTYRPVGSNVVNFLDYTFHAADLDDVLQVHLNFINDGLAAALPTLSQDEAAALLASFEPLAVLQSYEMVAKTCDEAIVLPTTRYQGLLLVNLGSPVHIKYGSSSSFVVPDRSIVTVQPSVGSLEVARGSTAAYRNNQYKLTACSLLVLKWFK